MSAVYLSAEPKTVDDAWLWIGMILGESWGNLTDYGKEKRQQRAYELFRWLEYQQRT